MPVSPIALQAKWKYEKTHCGTVFLIDPMGNEVASIKGKNLQERLDRASLLVRKLNK